MKQLRVLVMITLVISMVSALAVTSPVSVRAAGTCYPGSYISNTNGHNYVSFNTGKANAFYPNWKITKKPWLVQKAEWVTGKTMATWGPANAIGEVYAGFPWIDRLPCNYFFTPWDGFTICKT